MGISGVWRVVFGGGTWDGFAEVEERAWQVVAEQVEGEGGGQTFVRPWCE